MIQKLRNCFGLFYITVRHTLPKMCFLQSVLTSSPPTASRQTARSVQGVTAQCAGDACVGCSLSSLPLCQTSQCTLWLCQVRNHLSKTSDKHKLSLQAQQQLVLFPVWRVSLFETSLLTQLLNKLLSWENNPAKYFFPLCFTVFSVTETTDFMPLWH